jgi:hypothetical protein
MRKQNDLPVRKFECVVVSARIVHVYLSEAREFLSDCPLALPEEQKLKHGRRTLNFPLERHFGTRR